VCVCVCVCVCVWEQPVWGLTVYFTRNKSLKLHLLMFTKSKIVQFQFYTGTKQSYTSHWLSNFFNFLTLKIILLLLLLKKWTLTELTKTLTELTKTLPTFMQPNSKATSEKFHNLLDFNGEEFTTHPNSRMKNHPLSPVCRLLIQYICCFNFKVCHPHCVCN
jgi:hypothetical protein